MKKIVMTKFICICILLSSNLNLYSQSSSDDCSAILKSAKTKYELGRFSECIEMLRPCVKSLPNELVFESYRLMALSSMNLNDQKGTDQFVVKMLQNNPTYKDFPFFDELEFTRLLDKYDIWPKMEVGAKWSLNANSVNALKNYSLTNSEATYEPGIGFNIGLTFEYFIKKHLAVNGEVLFSRLNYSRTANNVIGWNQEYQERMSYYDVPVAARYYFYQTKKLQIGVEAGAQLSVLDKTNSNITLTNVETNGLKQNTYQAEDQRTNVLYYGLAGMMAKYKLGGGKLGFNLRYAHGLNTVNTPDNRLDDLNFAYNNLYLDSDFSFKTIAIGLSYSFPIPNQYSVERRK